MAYTVPFGAWVVPEGVIFAVPKQSTLVLPGLGTAVLLALQRRTET